MSSFSGIADSIFAVFEPLVGRKNIVIEYQNRKPVSVEILSKTLPKCVFLELSFSAKENNNIYIHGLKNCKERHMGLQLINLVENLSRRIGSHEITLIDMSNLVLTPNKSVPLFTLYNLTTGQSWYNKLGYICKDDDFNHDETFESNKNKITTMSVKDFATNEVERRVSRQMGEPMDKLLQKINLQFPELDPDQKIQEYFIIVKEKLQQYSNGTLSKDISLLVELINLISDAEVITTYPNKECLLVKEMNTASGGRIQKKHLSRSKKYTRKAIRRKTTIKKYKKNKTKRK